MTGCNLELPAIKTYFPSEFPPIVVGVKNSKYFIIPSSCSVTSMGGAVKARNTRLHV